MIQNINVEGLNLDQIQEIKARIEVLKAQNKAHQNEPESDMIDYLLENPLPVDNLEFMKREEIYDRNK